MKRILIYLSFIFASTTNTIELKDTNTLLNSHSNAVLSCIEANETDFYQGFDNPDLDINPTFSFQKSDYKAIYASYIFTSKIVLSVKDYSARAPPYALS